MYKGIDVSDNNGVLDWDAIKASGIEFAIIRIGVGSDEVAQDDGQAKRNMDECERLEIPYGVYIYSYALNSDNVSSEVQHTLRMIAGRKPVLGVWFDMEDADGYKVRNGLIPEESSETLTQFCNQFCTEMVAAGYDSGVYANKNYFDNILGEINYAKWLAIWGPEECPEGNWKMWQYSSDGVVCGSNARTDMNYYYGEIQLIQRVVEEIQAEAIIEPISAPQAPTDSYIVQSGDTLSTIASSYGTDYKTLAAFNGIADANLIYPGQVINFPGIAKTQIEQPTHRSYTVAPGDSLWGIAATQLGSGARYQEIKDLNGLTSDVIYPGNVLVLPQ